MSRLGMLRFFSVAALAMSFFGAPSFAGFNFTWTGPTSVGSGDSYTVGVAIDYWDSGGGEEFSALLARQGNAVTSGGAWQGTTVNLSHSPTDSGPQTINYQVEAWGYGNEENDDEYDTSYRTITVAAPNSPPLVTFGWITNSVYRNGTVMGGGWAADNEDGAPVNRVEVFIDGVYRGNAGLGQYRPDIASAYGRSDYTYSGFNFEFNVGLIDFGIHTVMVRAYDNQGNYADGYAGFDVPNRAPTVSASASSIYVGQSSTVTWSAGDPDSNFDHVDVWVTQWGSPYWDYIGAGAASGSLSWSGSAHFNSSNPATGSYLFVVRASDSSGAYTDYHATFDVTNRAPNNSAISTGGVTQLALGQSATITGTLQDPDGNLAFHTLYYMAPGGSTWVAFSGLSTAPSSGSSSSKSASFTPPSLGAWQLRSNGYDNCSAWGSDATWTINVVDGTAPSVPGNLSASNNTTGSSFTLNWSASGDNVGVTLYEVWRNGVSFGSTSATSLSITGLSQATAYSMAVRARDAAGNWSNLSTALSVTTPDVSAPTVPGGLGVANNTTGTSFTLSWGASGDNVGVALYEVWRNGSPFGTTTATSLSITGLSQTTTYSMTVRARDAANNWSNLSTALSVTTPDVTAPSKPAGLASNNVTTTSFTLSWAAAGDNVGVTGYDIYRNGTLHGSTTTATSLSITGLSSATNYSMTVRARDAAGNASVLSDALVVQTLDPEAPTTPTALNATNNTSGTSFTLNWTASTDNVGVTGYDVYRNGTLCASPAGTSCSVAGLTPGLTYSMTVKAKDGAGNISPSSTALGVTTADSSPPTVPGNLASSNRTETSFTLSWSASTDNGVVTAYQVRRDTTTLTPDATGTSLSVTGLNAGTTYAMSVRARDTTGNWSDWSTALSTATLLPASGDADNDGMPNGWEYQYDFDPLVAADASLDADRDGVTNLMEYRLGTNPRGANTNSSGSTELKVHKPN